MSNHKQPNQSMQRFKKEFAAFRKSKNFWPAVILVAALLVAILAGAVILVVKSRSDVPAMGDGSQPSSSVFADDIDYVAGENKVDEAKLVGTVLPETEDAGQEYLDETLFLGDSNTVRYMMYSESDSSKEPLTTVNNNIGVVSMGVTSITSLKCEQFEGYAEEVTMPEAVKILQPKRIIIGFGTNNLTMAPDTFIANYKEGLAAIHEAYPYADIIVNAIPPLDQQRENTRLSMKNVDTLNAAIAKMCEEEGYKYLDSSKALEDPETGWAKKDYTLGDGVHLSKDGVRAFFEYVRTHAYITEDTRPKPLKKIPKVKGVTPGLITDDPIAVRGARVPVEFVAGEGGRIEGPTSQRVKKGTATTEVVAIPNEGWEFESWSCTIGYVDQQPMIAFTVPADADANGVVVTARFKQIEQEPTPEPTPTPAPVCSCTKYCGPNQPNGECPVCKEHPEQCQGCNCAVKCDPANPKPDCPYCSQHRGECQGTPATTPPPVTPSPTPGTPDGGQTTPNPPPVTPSPPTPTTPGPPSPPPVTPNPSPETPVEPPAPVEPTTAPPVPEPPAPEPPAPEPPAPEPPAPETPAADPVAPSAEGSQASPAA